MAASRTSVDRQTVEALLEEWPDEPAEIAEDVIDEYGLPDEAIPSRLLWFDTGPWKRTELFRDGVPHSFPKDHTDYLEQAIDYRVPPETFDDLAAFDGSVYPDRTGGELAAKCDKEAMNFLAINLAHDIVTGETSIDDARQEYAVTAVKAMMGAEPEYTTDLRFELPEGDQHDPDETIVTDAMKEEVKEMLGGPAEQE